MMKKYILLTSILLSSSAFAGTHVNIDTNVGQISIELYDQEAPITTKNFLKYVKKDYYNGTIFHRVIPDFMIQAGGFDRNLQQKDTDQPIKNEASNGLKNIRGTIAMARTSNPNSATAQFFINTQSNNALDQTPFNDGYTVFGKVTQGMQVVDKISHVQTTRYGMQQNLPIEPIIIEKITIEHIVLNNHKNK
ncbi:peptidylprolyl isomerase [Acinetobacter boissieri]|uniref:Peptidyl-prolyl cis-trans isomerase n=1 Tax=Acinetobacter boissieri TaxID=1219383 RepID=A0A1G6K5G2_9GAMM|nr:peptidylprolyl isomerase [Acinetobacter boissieri]SDC26240.1 peptidyl-prolyl cis-trans isomerase A (cyclophilin A) [Acinetobacter boissieri]